MAIKKEQYQYIWYLLYILMKEDKNISEIEYVYSKEISPYMEMNMEDLNYENKPNDKQILEVNPFYRFTEIFTEFLNPNLHGKEEVRKKIFNIIIHILSNIDLQEGVNKRIILNRLITAGIESGRYGYEIKDLFKVLNKSEKIILSNGIQDKYKYNRELEVFKKVFKKIYSDSIIYDSLENEERIVIYINERKTEENRKKELLIEKLFLPVGLKTKRFWEHHFGVLEVEETMRIGEISIY